MATFQEIYREYGKPVYRFLLKLTGSRDQAEELLQETFYQAFLHIDRVKNNRRRRLGITASYRQTIHYARRIAR